MFRAAPFRKPAGLLVATMFALWAPYAPAREDREIREPPVIEHGGDRDREVREPRDVHEGEDRGGPDEAGREQAGSASGGRGGGHGDERRGKDHDRAGHGEPRHDRLVLERDEHGDERVRGEVVMIGSASDLIAIRAAGFQVLEQSRLVSLDAEVVRVRVPDARGLDETVRELARLAPAASIAADHVFRSSGASSAAAGGASANNETAVARIGLIDTGVATPSPLLKGSVIAQRGFTPGGYVPRAHGTAVADVAAHAGVTLLSADVFGVDMNDQPAATTIAVARAIDWQYENGVRVLNISLEGPDNPVLARVVRRAIDADIAVVAAAGNDGPAAAPAYPAAYPGVIAVTAVDDRGHIYRRANRGAYISFAALGVNVVTTGLDGRAEKQSGTSFAAPLVAAMLARSLAVDPALDEKRAVAALANTARDLGAPGRDDVFGYGELAAPPPAIEAARAR